MPLFFFDLLKCAPDLDGTELADLTEARTEAIRLFGGLMKDDPALVSQGEDMVVTVRDHLRMDLFTLNFFIAASSHVSRMT